MKTSIDKNTMNIRLIAQDEKDRRVLTRMRAKINKIEGACVSIGYTGHPKNQRIVQLFIPLHCNSIFNGISA